MAVRSTVKKKSPIKPKPKPKLKAKAKVAPRTAVKVVAKPKIKLTAEMLEFREQLLAEHARLEEELKR